MKPMCSIQEKNKGGILMGIEQLREDFEFEDTLRKIGRYWIYLRNSETEKTVMIQLRTFHNADYEAYSGGWADISARIQFFKAQGKFYLFNWCVYAGGSPHPVNENDRLLSLAKFGAKMGHRDSEYFVPELPIERYWD
jgi:hypothetical protein